jgi:hypothetical protein
MCEAVYLYYFSSVYYKTAGEQLGLHKDKYISAS